MDNYPQNMEEKKKVKKPIRKHLHHCSVFVSTTQGDDTEITEAENTGDRAERNGEEELAGERRDGVKLEDGMEKDDSQPEKGL